MYSQASNQIDTSNLTLEDFETALLIVEHFMKKYQQAQNTANRIAMFTRMGKPISGSNGVPSFETIMKAVMDEKSKQKAEASGVPQAETTTTPPEDIARMKAVVDKARAKAQPQAAPSQTQPASSSA